MNKPITFEEITCLNAKRFRHQLYQYPLYDSRGQDFSIGPVPVWQSPLRQPDNGMLAIYFHITIRHYVSKRRKQARCYQIA